MSLALRNTVNISKEHANSLSDSLQRLQRKQQQLTNACQEPVWGPVLICRREGSWLLTVLLLAPHLLSEGKDPLLRVSSWGAEGLPCCQRSPMVDELRKNSPTWLLPMRWEMAPQERRLKNG